jgi:hypothetical protein
LKLRPNEGSALQLSKNTVGALELSAPRIVATVTLGKKSRLATNHLALEFSLTQVRPSKVRTYEGGAGEIRVSQAGSAQHSSFERATAQ